MNAASPRIDTRTTRAANIVQAGDVHLSQPGLWRVRDAKTGSGAWHHVTETSCSCWDFQRAGLACKHLIAKDESQKVKMSGPTCPTCGSATEAERCYIGGRGYIWFASCRTNREHKAVKA